VPSAYDLSVSEAGRGLADMEPAFSDFLAPRNFLVYLLW
jgi:hypothetical protein